MTKRNARRVRGRVQRVAATKQEGRCIDCGRSFTGRGARARAESHAETKGHQVWFSVHELVFFGPWLERLRAAGYVPALEPLAPGAGGGQVDDRQLQLLPDEGISAADASLLRIVMPEGAAAEATHWEAAQ